MTAIVSIDRATARWLVIGGLALVAFLPALIALLRGHRNWLALSVANVFVLGVAAVWVAATTLGGTFLALLFASSAPDAAGATLGAASILAIAPLGGCVLLWGACLVWALWAKPIAARPTRTRSRVIVASRGHDDGDPDPPRRRR